MRAMIPIPNEFREFIRLLNARRVKYLVVGGYAVALHGYPRHTGDIDIFVERSARNIMALVKVFRDYGFKDSEPDPAIFLEKGNIVRIGIAPMRLEILNDIDGVSFSECYQTRVRKNFNGLRINFISLPALKKNKAASGRPKDLDDLQNLPE